MNLITAGLGGRSIVALAGLVLSAAAAQAGCHLKSIEIPVRLVQWRPLVNVSLDGQELPLLLDTGAFYSSINESTAQDLKLRVGDLPPNFHVEGYAGGVDARAARVKEVKIGQFVLRNQGFLVAGNELGAGIRGVLGRNFFGYGDLELDLANGHMRLVKPEGECRDTSLAYWAGQAPVIMAPLESGRAEDTALRVRVSINGKSMTALLDTGAPHTALKLRAAKRAGIAEDSMSLVGKATGFGVGRVRSFVAPLARFELGGETITDNQVAVDDTDQGEEDLLLGLDYFLSHRVYFSRLQNRMYATWNGGPVFARNPAASKGDTDQAAPGSTPDDAAGLARRGAASLARGDLSAALRDLDRACELAPGNPDYRVDRARARLQARQIDQALEDLDAALQLQPKADEARLLRAEWRIRRGGRAGALEDLQVLDETVSAASPQRLTLGRLYAMLDFPEPALRQWAAWLPAHDRDIRRAEMFNDRCWLRARLKLDLKLALQDCQSALSLDRNNAHYLDSLGWLQLRLGQAADARKTFDTALAQRNNAAWSLYGRALALRSLGDREAAASDLAAARKAQPAIDAQVSKAGFDAATE